MNEQRPNPDELLARLQQQETQARRGKLRIYFGSSAGVGKTFAMLEAAGKISKTGKIVIVGLVETHGRVETESLLENLEVLPRKSIDYHGKSLLEFDLDIALIKKPDLLLVDELAHSNVPNCRHPKRWQDIEELLNNGIDVWTTLNVQHLESLNDVISGITGIQVMETVPDSFFNQADEVVLVDIPVEELFQRLQAGKVYLSEQARRASQNFFRRGNLIALREITLRRTADRLEKDIQIYKKNQSITSVWKTESAILACVHEDYIMSEQIIRQAARLAGQMSVTWHAIYVETPTLQRLPTEQRERILNVLKLAEQLGATTTILTGGNIAHSIADYAHQHNLTTIVIGHTRHTYFWFWESSLLNQIAQLSPALDLVQVGITTSRPLLNATKHLQPKSESKITTYQTILAIIATVITTLITISAFEFFNLDLINLVMLHLLTVVLVATKLGRQPAIIATFLNIAAFDFFLIPPRFSFAVGDIRFIFTFCVMLLVGLIISHLTAGLRFQANISAQREKRAHILFELARDLSGALKTEQVIEIGLKILKQSFGGKVALILPDSRENLVFPTSTSELQGLDIGIAQWAFKQNEQAGFATNTLPANPYRYLPLRAPVRIRGILAICPHQQHWLLIPEQLRQLETCASLIAIALERVHFVEVAQEMTIHIESERLRNSLLSALSHDLRTPLTVLMGLAESLLFQQNQLNTQQQEIIHGITQTSLQMSNLVNNLLDMVRIEEGKMKLKCELQVLEEIIGSAIRAVHSLLGQRVVKVNLEQDLPLIPCDAILLERVFINLLENAAKYTPPNTNIEIHACRLKSEVKVDIIDNGEGLPKGQEKSIFEKFTRGVSESATSGVGLGLTICRAIIHAHHGKMTAKNHPQQGAIFSFTLPSQHIENIQENIYV
jgi:two-component system, OmpR family, sensor histidine kinase KdpD